MKIALENQSVDELMKLRRDLNEVLERKVIELQGQLKALGSGIDIPEARPRSKMYGRKVPAKYHDTQGHTWAGRGQTPRWLRDKLKRGAKLEDFAVGAKRRRATRHPQKKSKAAAEPEKTEAAE